MSDPRVGLITSADGAINPPRADRSGAGVTTNAHGRYQEAVLRGNVYTVSLIHNTVATTNNSPATAAGNPLVGAYNPVGSGKNLVILRAVVANESGTPAAQPLFVWNVIPNAGITAAGTAPVNNLTFTNTGSVAKAFSNSATTGSPAGTVLRAIGGATAVLITSGMLTLVEETAGEIIVQPGQFVGIYVGNGAGTTWIVSAAMSWEEVSI
jgi:hypothetical protein